MKMAKMNAPMKAMIDTKGKAVPDSAMKLHHRLAMGESVETGAGKGATAGVSKPSTRW